MASIAQPATLSEQIEARLATGFNARCLELAVAAHLDGTPRLKELRSRTILLEVPSKDRRRSYAVVIDRGVRTVWCECPAGSQFNRPCSHAGAAIDYAAHVARALAEYAEYAEYALD